MHVLVKVTHESSIRPATAFFELIYLRIQFLERIDKKEDEGGRINLNDFCFGPARVELVDRFHDRIRSDGFELLADDPDHFNVVVYMTPKTVPLKPDRPDL